MRVGGREGVRERVREGDGVRGCIMLGWARDETVLHTRRDV